MAASVDSEQPQVAQADALPAASERSVAAAAAMCLYESARQQAARSR